MPKCLIWLSAAILGFTILPLDARELKASIPKVPSSDVRSHHAVFIELVHLIDQAYTEGTIQVAIYPFRRSIQNVENGDADFHLPLIHNPDASYLNVKYRPISEPLVKTVFVIYSGKKHQDYV